MYEKCDPTLEEVLTNSKFPVTAYHKYNGYLGLVSYDFVNDDFFIATKSTNAGDYKNWFKEILEDRKVLTDDLKNYLKDNDVTMVFEVLDPFNDPHIIEYDYKTIILLDVIHNSFEYSKYDYKSLVRVANDFGFEHKYPLKVLNTKEELDKFLSEFDSLYSDKLEGAVFEDASGWMFKYKTKYYKFWKEMRQVKDKMRKGHAVKKVYSSSDWVSFYKFLEKLPPDELELDIISLRNKWKSIDSM